MFLSEIKYDFFSKREEFLTKFDIIYHFQTTICYIYFVTKRVKNIPYILYIYI